jgi:hypothetical protein
VYTKAFQTLKGNRTLAWKPSLGRVQFKPLLFVISLPTNYANFLYIIFFIGKTYCLYVCLICALHYCKYYLLL